MKKIIAVMAVLITLFSMGNVSASAAAKVAGSVKDPDGSKSWAAAWCIRTCWKCAASIPKNIPDSPSE